MSENKNKYIVLAGKLLPKMFSALIKSFKLLKLVLLGASFAAYTLMFSWKIALMILIGIGIHESFHVFAMKKIGMKTKGFFFIPFFGGVAIGTEPYKSFKDKFFVAIAGPVSGIVLGSICFLLYYLTNSIMWVAVASWLAFVNLFNLLPLGQLDGGQVLTSLFYSINNKAGYIIAALSSIAFIIFCLKLNLFLFAIFAAISSVEYVIAAYRLIKKGKVPYMYQDIIKMNKKELISSTLIYLSVFGILVVVMVCCKHMLPESTDVFEILN